MPCGRAGFGGMIIDRRSACLPTITLGGVPTVPIRHPFYESKHTKEVTLVTPLIWGDQPILSKRLFRHIRHIKTASQEALSCNCRSVEPVEVSREDFFDRFRRPSQGQKVRQTRGQMP